MLVGPLSLLFSLALLTLAPYKIQFYIPLVSLIGLGLVYQWGMQGFAVAALCMLTLFIYHFSSLSSPEKLWEGGSAISLLLGLLITVLSIEEAQEQIAK